MGLEPRTHEQLDRDVADIEQDLGNVKDQIFGKPYNQKSHEESLQGRLKATEDKLNSKASEEEQKNKDKKAASENRVRLATAIATSTATIIIGWILNTFVFGRVPGQ